MTAARIPLWRDQVPHLLVCVPQHFPRNCLHKERQECACPEQSEKQKVFVCYLHSCTNGKAGFAGFQIIVLAKCVEKHRLHTRCSGCCPGTAKIQIPERTAKGSVTRRDSSLSCSAAVCAGGRKARGRGAEDAAAEWLHREWAEPAVRESICLGTGGYSPRTETCSQNKNLMRHRKPLWPLSCLNARFWASNQSCPQAATCVPALHPCHCISHRGFLQLLWKLLS